MAEKRIAIVGAGPAGALAAHLLRERGADVVVLEKSRGPGGRCATRWAEEGRWDHGAPGFTVTDPALEPLIRQLEEQEILTEWKDPSRDGESMMWVGNPSMSALSGGLLDGVEVMTQTRVTGMGPGGLLVAEKQGEVTEVRADHVVFAIPVPQVSELLDDAHPFQEALRRVEYGATLTAMLEFDGPVSVQWNRLEVDDPILQSVIRNQTKSGRPAGERWVLHGTAEDSEKHLHMEKEGVADRLWKALQNHQLELPAPSRMMGHRWKYAHVLKPCGVPFLRSDSLSVIGDGMLGGGVEGALRSAQEWVQSWLEPHA